jgi:hypothetical protein
VNSKKDLVTGAIRGFCALQVFDVLFGTVTATIVAGSLVLAYAWFWHALPVSRRIHSSRSRR